MPKGEKIRPKQEMDQLPLDNFEKVELEFLFVKILLFVSYCQKLVSCEYSCLSLIVKSWSLVGRMVDYGK
jgi:hypothetical protein